MTTFNLRNTTINIGDNAFANFIEVKIGDGNFTYSEKVNREYLMDRGVMDEVIDGDDVPMDVSFDFRWQFITGQGAAITIEDALKKWGNASGWVSSGAVCEPYCVDIQVQHTPICTANHIELLVFPEFRYEELSHDAKGRSISCKGRCNTTRATATRVAQ